MNKVFVTVPFVERHPRTFGKMTLEDLLFNNDWTPTVSHGFGGGTSTMTFVRDADAPVLRSITKYVKTPRALIEDLARFNERYSALIDTEDKSTLYRTFHIPKKSGGLRRIDAPQDELMNALRELQGVFKSCGMLYHTSAFAYIEGRSTIDAIKRHQKNESKWFAKFDLHNFFGSTTPEFVREAFYQVYPFSHVLRNQIGSAEFDRAISLAFLNGVLPQGTPVSPIITNIMMIPFDYIFTKICRGQGLVYTRYADDFIVSGRTRFDYKAIEARICELLAALEAPFTLNKEKTRFGSSAGSNWNLGVMLNKDNNITVGNRNKRRFETMLFNYAMDRKNNNRWPIEDIRTLDGLRSYYKMVEGEVIDKIVQHVSQKVGFDIANAIRYDISA